MTEKKINCIGLTGPSTFTSDCIRVVEDYYDANPIMLYQNKDQNLQQSLKQCDAVILAGGKDIHPRMYGGNIYNDKNYSDFDIERDRRELKVINYCLANNIPVLGICRGHQMLGLYHGMDFVEDLTYGTVCHSPFRQQLKLSKNEPTHAISILDKNSPLCVEHKPGEAFDRALDDKKLTFVNSFHHQAIVYNDKSKKMTDVKVLATARSTKDLAIVEAMCGKGWLSCQWHPEYDWDVNDTSEAILQMFAKEIDSSKE